jgi:hypothetical protein
MPRCSIASVTPVQRGQVAEPLGSRLGVQRSQAFADVDLAKVAGKVIAYASSTNEASLTVAGNQFFAVPIVALHSAVSIQ